MQIKRVMRLRSELEARLLRRSVAEINALRDEIGRAIGGAGPDRWLTITFTADPAQL